MQDLDFMFQFSIRYFLKTKELLKDEKKCMFLSEYKTQCFYVWKYTHYNKFQKIFSAF